jgi:hypothetical protein
MNHRLLGERCPIFDTRNVRWPVLERRSLSLKKQKELRRWMVTQAVQSAEPLVMGESDTLGSNSDDEMNEGAWNSFAWTNPSKTYAAEL